MAINQESSNGPAFGLPADYVDPGPGFDVMDYASIAVSRLTSQFSESPKLQEMVRAIFEPLRDVEIMAHDLIYKRSISTARGVNLDGCGAIVGEMRQGRDDDEYREAIRFRVFINTSRGTPGDIIKATTYLTKPVDAQIIEQKPASVMMFTDGVGITAETAGVIGMVAPAAVEFNLLVSYGYKPFRFGSAPPPDELFVNNNADYLTIDGADFQVSPSESADDGSMLAGLAAGNLYVDGGYILDLNGGFEFAINSPSTSIVLESGHNLTGVH